MKVGHGPAERDEHVLEPVDLGVEVINLEVEFDEDGWEHQKPLARLIDRGLGLRIGDLDQHKEAAGGTIHNVAVVVVERVLGVPEHEALTDFGRERLGHGGVQHLADLCQPVLGRHCNGINVDSIGQCFGLDLGKLTVGVPIEEIDLDLDAVGISDGGIEYGNAAKELGPALHGLNERREV